MRRMTTLLVLPLLWFYCPTSSLAADTRPLVLNTSYAAPITSPDKTGFLDLFYAELFGRLNIPFEIQSLPAERALQNANAGVDDGDVCRIADLVNQYTNMVRSREPIMPYHHAVFSRHKNFTITGPESLTPYSVGLVTGWKIVERTTQQVPSRTLVDSPEQLFVLLDQERIEVAVIERMVGLETVHRLGLKGIRVLSPPLLSGDWFLYLHKKHAALLPRIDAEVRKMKRDGTYDRLWRQVYQRYEKSVATSP